MWLRSLLSVANNSAVSSRDALRSCLLSAGAVTTAAATSINLSSSSMSARSFASVAFSPKINRPHHSATFSTKMTQSRLASTATASTSPEDNVMATEEADSVDRVAKPSTKSVPKQLMDCQELIYANKSTTAWRKIKAIPREQVMAAGILSTDDIELIMHNVWDDPLMNFLVRARYLIKIVPALFDYTPEAIAAAKAGGRKPLLPTSRAIAMLLRAQGILAEVEGIQDALKFSVEHHIPLSLPVVVVATLSALSRRNQPGDLDAVLALLDEYTAWVRNGRSAPFNWFKQNTSSGWVGFIPDPDAVVSFSQSEIEMKLPPLPKDAPNSHKTRHRAFSRMLRDLKGGNPPGAEANILNAYNAVLAGLSFARDPENCLMVLNRMKKYARQSFDDVPQTVLPDLQSYQSTAVIFAAKGDLETVKSLRKEAERGITKEPKFAPHLCGLEMLAGLRSDNIPAARATLDEIKSVRKTPPSRRILELMVELHSREENGARDAWAAAKGLTKGSEMWTSSTTPVSRHLAVATTNAVKKEIAAGRGPADGASLASAMRTAFATLAKDAGYTVPSMFVERLGIVGFAQLGDVETVLAFKEGWEALLPMGLSESYIVGVRTAVEALIKLGKVQDGIAIWKGVLGASSHIPERVLGYDRLAKLIEESNIDNKKEILESIASKGSE